MGLWVLVDSNDSVTSMEKLLSFKRVSQTRVGLRNVKRIQIQENLLTAVSRKVMRLWLLLRRTSGEGHSFASRIYVLCLQTCWWRLHNPGLISWQNPVGNIIQTTSYNYLDNTLTAGDFGSVKASLVSSIGRTSRTSNITSNNILMIDYNILTFEGKYPNTPIKNLGLLNNYLYCPSP